MTDRPPPTGRKVRPHPYRGSKILTVRVPQELLDLMDELVRHSETRRVESPHTRSSFILAAIEEKIKKMARSARREHGIPEAYERDQYPS